jgi:hypothetical protein
MGSILPGGMPAIQGPAPMTGVPGIPKPCGPSPSDLGPPPIPDSPNSFHDGCPTYGFCGYYAGLGFLAMQRGGMGHLPIAVVDPQNLDTGDPPPPGRPVAVDLNMLNPQYAFGVRGNVGYRWECGALEFSGYWIPENTSSHTTNNPGRLDAPFFNPPLGFEGDNGLWLQADQMVQRVLTRLGNAEFNWRIWACPYDMWEFLVGVRYLDIKDRYELFTDDDGLTIRDFGGQPDPLRQATYSIQAHNHLAAPQLGIQWNGGLAHSLVASIFVKGGWGYDFYDVDLSLVRGDGLVGREGHRSGSQFSMLYETGLILDWCVIGNTHVRVGYQALWVVDVPVASDQIDFNLLDTTGRANNHGSLLYHGPIFEVECVF